MDKDTGMPFYGIADWSPRPTTIKVIGWILGGIVAMAASSWTVYLFLFSIVALPDIAFSRSLNCDTWWIDANAFMLPENMQCNFDEARHIELISAISCWAIIVFVALAAAAITFERFVEVYDEVAFGKWSRLGIPAACICFIATGLLLVPATSFLW